jgi:protein-L-isoaspartate(D-aspartate) O-methyltransferase
MASVDLSRFIGERHLMVEQQLRKRGIRDQRVLAAFERVPRHLFVDERKGSEAYEDHPVSIGEQQTTSQPFMIATMLEVAEIQPADKVLEIGTGSGYQTALLAELAAEVFSVERFPALAAQAQHVIAQLHYANIVITTGDGSLGLPQHSPFAAIVVSAAAPRVPEALLHQLSEGGKLVVPVGEHEDQVLQVLRRTPDGFTSRSVCSCKFVPLIGAQGF